MAVGDEKRSKSLQTLKCFVSVLFGSVLVGWSTWKFGISTIEMLSIPDKVLEQIALILAQKQELGLSDNFLQISD